MVAETLPRPKKKHQGFRPTIPLPLKLKVRSLYILQQLSPQDIGKQVGLTREQVQNLISREGWSALKQRTKQLLTDKHDARVKAEIEEVHEAFALKTEELGMGTLFKAEKAMKREDEDACRDLQALSQTAKNFYGIARQARGLDSQQSESKGQTTVVFLGDLPRVSREEKPCVEVEVSLTPSAPTPTDAPSKPKEAPISVTEGKDTGAEPVAPMD